MSCSAGEGSCCVDDVPPLTDPSDAIPAIAPVETLSYQELNSIRGIPRYMGSCKGRLFELMRNSQKKVDAGLVSSGPSINVTLVMKLGAC